MIMERTASFIVLFFMACILAFEALAIQPDQLVETRYCGTPLRNADGTIKRSTTILKAFQKLHPCPSTGKTDGACPGWAINHTIPLACGGCDAVRNMDWMPDEIKSCAGPWCRDRWERKVYDQTPSIAGTDACTNGVVTWVKQ